MEQHTSSSHASPDPGDAPLPYCPDVGSFQEEQYQTRLRKAADRLAELRQTLDPADSQAIMKLAHTLSAAGAEVGVASLSEMGQRLQQLVEGEDLGQIHELLSRVNDEFLQLRRQIEDAANPSD